MREPPQAKLTDDSLSSPSAVSNMAVQAENANIGIAEEQTASDDVPTADQQDEHDHAEEVLEVDEDTVIY